MARTIEGLEFSQIYLCSLRGNARTAGEQRKKEGGTVFDAGSRATVAITILVRNPASTAPATLHYNEDAVRQAHGRAEAGRAAR